MLLGNTYWASIRQPGSVEPLKPLSSARTLSRTEFEGRADKKFLDAGGKKTFREEFYCIKQVRSS